MNNTITKNNNEFNYAGLFALSIRLVVGWTYFSAFWRRLILENKLDPELPGYIGEKFNHFLPNALGIGPMIEYMVSNPEVLWWAMAAFTIVEAIVGLFIMLGLFTRLMSLGVFGLAMGILLGSGWIGTTCLDEWQIGILGLASGFTLFLSGGGPVSIDNRLITKYPQLAGKEWFRWLGSGAFPLSGKILHKLALGGALVILLISLYTNQVFHCGVWGKLHNKSVRPKLEITDARLEQGALNFEVFRVEGVDVYGSFLIGITLTDDNGNAVIELDGQDLAEFPAGNIDNYYVAKIKPGKHSMILPLGAKATITIRDNELQSLTTGNYTLTLTDISGLTWSVPVN